MASRPNKGEGLTPLPTPQQQSAFIAALLAPLPKGERRDVNEVVAEREARQDVKQAWGNVFRMLQGVHRAYQLAEHERCRWIGDDFPRQSRPAPYEAAIERTQYLRAEIVRLLSQIVDLPAASRAQTLDKQQAYERYTSGVAIEPATRQAWKAAIAAELARFPKQVRGKVARDA
ncbi:MAG: hypothetical protein Q7J32_17520 [Sphingomonadaceae bacterium]|nr:hypothetical protein [Sphingomonadaceae bacterium]